MAVYVNEETGFRYIIKTGRPDPCPSLSRWEAVWGPNFQNEGRNFKNFKTRFQTLSHKFSGKKFKAKFQILRQEIQSKISNSQARISKQDFKLSATNSQARISKQDFKLSATNSQTRNSKQNFPKPQVSSAGAD